MQEKKVNENRTELKYLYGLRKTAFVSLYFCFFSRVFMFFPHIFHLFLRGCAVLYIQVFPDMMLLLDAVVIF